MRDQGWFRQQIVGRLWIWPAVSALLAVMAAELLVRLDRRFFQVPSAWVFGGDATAAGSVKAVMSGLVVTFAVSLDTLRLVRFGQVPSLTGTNSE